MAIWAPASGSALPARQRPSLLTAHRSLTLQSRDSPAAQTAASAVETERGALLRAQTLRRLEWFALHADVNFLPDKSEMRPASPQNVHLYHAVMYIFDPPLASPITPGNAIRASASVNGRANADSTPDDLAPVEELIADR
jgi:hypothetical protein